MLNIKTYTMLLHTLKTIFTPTNILLVFTLCFFIGMGLLLISTLLINGCTMALYGAILLAISFIGFCFTSLFF